MSRRGTWIGVAVAIVCALAPAGARAASYWTPPRQLTWYWQLTGTPSVEPVQATDMDGSDNSAATVAAFHARGQRAICYIDVGTWEDWRSDASAFPKQLAAFEEADKAGDQDKLKKMIGEFAAAAAQAPTN